MKRLVKCAAVVISTLMILCVGTLILNTTSARLLQEKAQINPAEEAYRANNIGVALLEQFKHKEAADSFRRALQLQPKLTLARINLGIALFNIPDLPAAQRELRAAATQSPSSPQPHYVLGLMAKTQTRTEDAISAFQHVLRIDPNDVGTNVNLGQLYGQQRKYPEAIASLRTALAVEPYNATALYNLGTSLIRAGNRNEGQKIIKQFQALRESGSGTTLGMNYLEQGRYSEALASTGVEAGLVDKRTPEVVYTDVTTEVLPPAGDWPITDAFVEQDTGAVLLFDYDLDGDLDLLEAAGSRLRLLRNDGGKFTDVTPQSGALSKDSPGVATAVVSGDYDNDGRPDLFVLRYGTPTLYHNDGNGSFSDVTAAAKIPAYPYLSKSVAFVDVDHDGDLDIFIAGFGDIAEARKQGPQTTSRQNLPPAPNLLLRNNGDKTFSDTTSASKLSNVVSASSIVPTDFDNRRDIDLVAATAGGMSIWRNMRDGTFRDVAQEAGLSGAELRGATSIAAGDVNKDGFTDFYMSPAGAFPGFLALSDGKERFEVRRTSGSQTSFATDASQFIDYDNDGLLDLITAGTTSAGQIQLRVLRNVGDGWIEVSEKATQSMTAPVAQPRTLISRSRVMASGDLDGDGDKDIIFGVPGGGLRVARNNGGSSNGSLRVNLIGRVGNRSAVGAKIEMRSGSLAQKLETYSTSPAAAPADVVFGLGRRTTADAVRVLWPAGIVQAETTIGPTPEAGKTASALTLSVTELDRKPSSCPYLYVWNGERFEFVTDFLGGGEMGHLESPGVFNTPDPDEYVRIPGDQLQPRNGRYELRVTNELEEALFLDQVQLVAVAHPRGVEVFPNEGLIAPPFPLFKLYATRGAKPPLSAVDEHGHDVLSRISHLDRQYPDDFRTHQIRGYADEHLLTMTLDEATASRTLLLLTGWTDYAWSSDNLAASQSEKVLKPPALQVKNARGEWTTVIENIGIPVGRPQTVVVDLSGQFLSSAREVRIVTNMRIYWDQILVDTSSGDFKVEATRLNPDIASLRWRGFSHEFSRDGRQPLGYDYQNVSLTSPWKIMTGRYTREGNVLPLLVKSDSMFVVSRPGDEISISFAGDKLPHLPQGWTRTFLLYAVGFSKEMDINSASPDEVGPLPFHGMRKYPYSWPERYPLTRERSRYLEQYNTRVVTSPVPRLETELLGGT
ncbi:MAG TPA: FG-GAP-like repeat-containing protein [Pyrinomonadaceae bacterium]|nr:FG-GAP-like repeat-containing protein [Pyrinomonadaceae bacterium]